MRKVSICINFQTKIISISLLPIHIFKCKKTIDLIYLFGFRDNDSEIVETIQKNCKYGTAFLSKDILARMASVNNGDCQLPIKSFYTDYTFFIEKKELIDKGNFQNIILAYFNYATQF